jgi:hypothetical protein
VTPEDRVPLRGGATGITEDAIVRRRRAQETVSWDGATGAVHDAGHAWREVMGHRRQLETEASDEAPRRSTFL